MNKRILSLMVTAAFAVQATAAKVEDSFMSKAQSMATAFGTAVPTSLPVAPAPGPDKPVCRPAALGDILSKVKDERKVGQTPVVVFDIDDTLFDSSYRDVRILRELSRDAGFRGQYPQEAKIIADVRVKDSQHRYNVVDTAMALGVSNQAALQGVLAASLLFGPARCC